MCEFCAHGHAKLRLGPGSREGPGRRRPVIAGQTRYGRAGTGKTDGINRTYGLVMDACFVIAGQNWRSSPLMTLDHAGRLVRCGVSRGNGGNARPAGCPGRRLPAFDPRYCPGAAALQFTAALPGRNRARQASRPGPGHSLPRLAGWFRTALSGLRTRRRAHCWGGKPEGRVAAGGWPG